MEQHCRERLHTFTLTDLPDLDVAVLGALDLFEEEPLAPIPAVPYKNPLIIGSVNALSTAKILFEKLDAVYADESTYESILESHTPRDGAILVSASGGKHAIGIAEKLAELKVPLTLLTNNPQAPAGAYVTDRDIIVFPKNREPYTYNTSTYMGMFFARTGEDPRAIRQHIAEVVKERIPTDFSVYDSFFIMVPPQFEKIRSMLLTKFDELFGGRVSGRVFTIEEAKHAKTVVPSDKELFISFGDENTLFGMESQRLHIPLAQNAGYAAMMAVGYYVIGQIQKQHPPYFKQSLPSYVEDASRLFGYTIEPIVE